jgi:hypothetical protein
MYITIDLIESKIGALYILTGVAVFFVYQNQAGKGSHCTQLEVHHVLIWLRNLWYIARLSEKSFLRIHL